MMSTYLTGITAEVARLIRQGGPCNLKPENSVTPFAALVEAVVYQQLNGKAAGAILDKLGLADRKLRIEVFPDVPRSMGLVDRAGPARGSVRVFHAHAGRAAGSKPRGLAPGGAAAPRMAGGSVSSWRKRSVVGRGGFSGASSVALTG